MESLLSAGFLDVWSGRRHGIAPAQTWLWANQHHDLPAEAQRRVSGQGVRVFDERQEL